MSNLHTGHVQSVSIKSETASKESKIDHTILQKILETYFFKYRVGNQIVHSFKSHFFDSSNLNFTKLFNQNKQQYCCKRPREEKMPKNQRPSRQEQQRLRAVDLVRAHLILYFSSILRAPSARPGHQEEADERG